VTRVRTAKQAAAWLDRVGIALLLVKADVVLPSLWEAVKGDREQTWAIRDAEGAFVEWSEEMGVVWRLKDELPDRGLACVGKHLGGGVACIAPWALPLLYALTGRAGTPDDFRAELDGLELQLAEAVLEEGARSGPELRELVGAPKPAVGRALARLQRRLVLTNAGLVEREQGWPAVALELVPRAWQLPKLPSEAEARRALARLVLDAAGELTAADLAAALGWRRKVAAQVLDEVAEGRDGDGFRIWMRH
jgi:DNA glycosylase AlkZ-like